MITEEELEEFNAIKDLPIIKTYCDLLHKLRSFKEEPEMVFYKSVNGKDYYIEMPYNDIDIVNDKWCIRRRGYSYRYKTKNSTCIACLSLCNYSYEKIIEEIEKKLQRM